MIDQLLIRGGDRNTCTLSHFMLLKLEMSTSLMDHLACKQTMYIDKFTNPSGY